MKPEELISISLYLNGYDNIYNEKMLNYSVKLLIEIVDLIEKGYSKEEIRLMIDNIYLDSFDEEELESLKMEGYRILDIRYKIYKENKKVKKYLF